MIGGSQDAQVARLNRSGAEACAVAVHGHIAQHIDVDDPLAEMIYGGFCRLHHVFHECFAFEPTRVILVVRGSMDHFLAYGPVRAANGDILQGTAEAAHGVTFEMGQHQHRVVIQHMFADRHFLEIASRLDWESSPRRPRP